MTASGAKGRRGGILRVIAFLTVVNLGVTAVYLPRARAQVESLAVSRGLEVLKALGPIGEDTEQAMQINGQRMHLAARVTALPVSEVLSLFERDCHEHAGGLGAELAKLPAEKRGAIPKELRDPSRWLTLKEEPDERGGHVACFTRASQSESLKSFIARLSAFAKTGELAELGDAHYVVARRDERTKRTQVLALWTEGSFNVLDMFPASGDAPGRDSELAPRPPAAVRVLSAEAPDRPYALRMYDSRETAEHILAFYERSMRERGFTRVELTKSAELDLNRFAQTFEKDGRAVIVVVGVTPEQKSGVNLIEMGSSGFATAEVRP